MSTNKRKTGSITLLYNKRQTLLKTIKLTKIVVKQNCEAISKCDISALKNVFNPTLPTQIVAIHGPVGCGKTYITETLAKQTNYTITIFDPSSTCNISEELQLLTATQNKFKKNANPYKIMFIDDVDALSKKQLTGIIQYIKKNHKKERCCSIVISYTSNKDLSALLKVCDYDIIIQSPSFDQLMNFGKNVKSTSTEHKAICAIECNGDIRQFMRMIGIVRLNDSTDGLTQTCKTRTSYDTVRDMLKYPDTASDISSSFGNSYALIPLVWNAVSNVYEHFDLDISHLATVQNTLNECNIHPTHTSYEFNMELHDSILGVIPSAYEIPYTSDVSSRHVQRASQIKKLSDSYLLYK